MFLSVSFGRTITLYIDFLEIGGAYEETYAVVEIRGSQPQEAAYILEEVECSRALFELYEGGVVGIMLFVLKTWFISRDKVHASGRDVYREFPSSSLISATWTEFSGQRGQP
jgi:hypothetical protein